MPFRAAARMATAVDLARCSAPERVRSIADSGAVGGTHNTGCRARFCSFAVGAGGLRACSGCCAPNGTYVTVCGDAVRSLQLIAGCDIKGRGMP